MHIEPQFHLCGTSALLMDVAQGPFSLERQKRLWTLCSEKGAFHDLPGASGVLLGVNNVAVTFDPFTVDLHTLQSALSDAWAQSVPFEGEGSLVEVPVTYKRSPEFDLIEAAARAQLSVEDLVALHTSVDYRVACIGWIPGFAFLVGLPPALVAPRRANPRIRVPKGAVGIGGAQTGVIPLEVPSGWNLLGLTDVELFSPERSNPCLLRPGDRVRFVAQGVVA